MAKYATKKIADIEWGRGESVLVGSTRASYPLHWYYGRVLWKDARHVLIERSSMNGETWREVVRIEEIRAVGDRATLEPLRLRAFELTRELNKAVTDAESALGRARDALFAKLSELQSDGLLPPDFAAITAAEKRDRDAFDASDDEAFERARFA